MTEQNAGLPNRRPPYRYVEGNVDFTSLIGRAGLDIDEYADQDYLATQGLQALYELFSDGEIRVVNLAESTGTDRTAPDGKARHGNFYAAFLKLTQEAQSDEQLQDEINRLARFCGNVLGVQVARDDIEIPGASRVKPSINTSLKFCLGIGDQEFVIRSNPGIILEYGPGLVGKRFIDAQAAMLKFGITPIQYIPVSDGPFVNQFLMTYSSETFQKNFGKEVASQFSRTGLLAGREDGMLQASEELVQASQQPMCDVIILAGVHRAEAEELQETLKLVSKLLKKEGVLILSAPIPRVEQQATTFEEQLIFAREAGLKLSWRGEEPSGDIRLGTQTTSGLAFLVSA
jgi:hypothetical protein